MSVTGESSCNSLHPTISRKRKKSATGQPDLKWSHLLPREVLSHIFSFYVESEGIKPLLVYVSKVCVNWKDAATDLKLYRIIDDPYLSKVALMNLKTKLSLTHHLNLSYLENFLTAKFIMELLPYSPKLKTLKVSLKNLKKQAEICHLMKKLPEFCPILENVSLQNCNLHASGLSPLLEMCGQSLKCLNLSENVFTDFSLVARNIAKTCPLLEELYLCKVSGTKMVFPFDIFQSSCPKLRILELEDLEFPTRNINSSLGFPNLESFAYKAIYVSSLQNGMLEKVLKSSSKLTSLDLQGNKHYTGEVFFTIPCELETLYLSRTNISGYTLHWIMKRWKHSLRSLDLSSWSDEIAINDALKELVSGNEHNKLEALNVSNSAITMNTLKRIVQKCQSLEHLNIESCRNLQRGIKRVYRTHEEINVLCKLFDNDNSASDDNISSISKKRRI